MGTSIGLALSLTVIPACAGMTVPVEACAGVTVQMTGSIYL